jgi:hypothetical protein
MKNALAVLLVLLLFDAPAWAAVAYDTVSSSACTGCTNDSWSHTTTGTNTFMMCGGGFNDSSGGTTITAMTYSAQALTVIADETPSGTAEFRAIVYKRTAPATGANAVVITYSQAVNSTLGCLTFTGVDQATPDEAETFDNDNSDGLSVGLTVPADGMGAAFGVYNEDVSCTNSTTTNTERFNLCNDDFNVQGMGSTTATTGVTSMNYTTAATDAAVLIAVPINPAAGAAAAIRRRAIVIE